ncbi:hypothetical protein AEGHOMDF_4758 [Methylobacterium soli]|nr:hypothetical protein AEGHOMDF_4758 [Methylobacterium soli]
MLGEDVRRRIRRPLLQHDVHHLRDDVARALHHHGIADPDVTALTDRLAVAPDALDIPLVVERGVRHNDAPDRHGPELRQGVERAGAPDIDRDLLHHREGLLGRELVGERPARRPGDEAEAALQGEVVNLVDHAIDVVAEIRPLRLDRAIMRDHGRRIGAQDCVRVHRQAPGPEPLHHAELAALEGWGHLAPGIGEEAQGARGRDRGIELAKRPGGGVARVGKERLAGRLLPGVDRGEIRVVEIDLAAHLADFRHVLARQRLGNIRHRPGIRRHVLADLAIAPGRRRDEAPVLVAQGQGQPVDLRLGGEAQGLGLRPVQEAPDPGHEFLDLALREGVAEREHRHRVPDLAELVGWLGADRGARRTGPGELRDARLDGLELPPQGIVGGIRHDRRVRAVIGLVRLRDLGREGLVPGARLRGRHAIGGLPRQSLRCRGGRLGFRRHGSGAESVLGRRGREPSAGRCGRRLGLGGNLPVSRA